MSNEEIIGEDDIYQHNSQYRELLHEKLDEYLRQKKIDVDDDKLDWLKVCVSKRKPVERRTTYYVRKKPDYYFKPDEIARIVEMYQMCNNKTSTIKIFNAGRDPNEPKLTNYKLKKIFDDYLPKDDSSEPEYSNLYGEYSNWLED